ncbi:hypothetical protein E2C01_071088 [Portunus trituberculatus]|uniref:Uncharacterized protein n=1 Tax=Portunus trituberculatus TaxID=210409 RepID=A0A5B7I766_PORTR|nr:hypothetical protein [Portunus trituberculatus]
MREKRRPSQDHERPSVIGTRRAGAGLPTLPPRANTWHCNKGGGNVFSGSGGGGGGGVAGALLHHTSCHHHHHSYLRAVQLADHNGERIDDSGRKGKVTPGNIDHDSSFLALNRPSTVEY